ncbi:glycosyltransferase family 4 protein [Pontibacter anaerobius]|uniref:Glycosyltransferase family 4 protein n=1 Tax=Pontibacter anaerobius TaxID=2993940 RepID=A0ABT3RAK7_9BACT|nr:glycosyltransferase family 4 protein [Pontibacter anaerobius]MCX2738471.1 glycosyltransferase family 4 protein [Pontibacter anaerobius]
MRVLHIASERTWRGGEQQIAYLIEELQQQQVENFVACRRGSAFESYCQQQGIPHISLSFAKPLLPLAASQLKQYVNANGIQLLHLHSSLAHTLGVLTHMMGSQADLILSRRVEFSIGKNPLSAFKYNYGGIKRIICVAEAVCRQMAASIKDGSRCVTVHSGIDIEKVRRSINPQEQYLRNTYNIPQHFKLIGNVSALDKHKDYFTFLDTVKLLKEQSLQAKYFAIGSGPLEQEIKEYAIQLGLQEDVIFTGFLKNARQVLAELDLFLFTTIKEGLGSTVLDAFACGTPVVATNTGGIPEMVEDGITGMLAPVKSPEKLAQKCLQVLQDPELRKRLVENASRKVLEFSKQQTALKTLAVYKEVLST